MNLKTTNFIRKFATFFLALCYAVGWGQLNADFNDITGTGGNDGKWSGSIASGSLSSYTTGGTWVLSNVFKGNGCLRVSTSSNAGSVTTPGIGISGNVTVSFRAGSWSGDATNITVTASSGTLGAITPALNPLSDAKFTTYTATLTGASATTTLTFAALDKKKFFLDDIVVTAAAPACTGPTTAASAFAATNITTTSADLGWTSGNGTNRVVFVKGGTFTSATPANKTTYAANPSFTGAGTAFDGGKAVYNSSGSSVSVTNLTPNTAYNAKVFEFLGAAGSECYNTTALSGSFTTVSNPPGVLDASNLADVSFDANWTAPSGNGSAAYTYTLEYSTSSTFASNVTAVPNIASGTTTRTISGLTPATNYYYRVKVVNAGGSSAWSATKQTTTKPSAPPAPGAPTQACGSTTYPAYTGAAAGTYYWQTAANGNSTANPGTSPFTVTASGTYYVRSLNGANWSAATPVNAVVINNPTITAQPANKTVANGATATFSVTATDAGSYQWQENTGSGWNNITNGGNYSGATTATLSVAKTLVSQTGYQYQVIVRATAPCTNNITSSAATLTVTQTTQPTNHFRSVATGLWDNNSTWEASADSVTWYPATAFPTSSASSIVISTNDSVKVNSTSLSAANLYVRGKLALNQQIDLADNPAEYDLVIDNGGIAYYGAATNTNDAIRLTDGAKALVRTGGKIVALTSNDLKGPGYGNKYFYENEAVLEYKNSQSITTSGITYFPNAGPGVTPVFRFSGNLGSIGAGSTTTFKGRVEVASGISVGWNQGGTRVFRDGLINNGSMNMATGNLSITGTNAQLGGTGTTTFGTNNSLIIETGAVATLVTDMKFASGTVTVNGTLSNSPNAYIIKANKLNIAAGGKFVTYSEGGLFGGTNSAIQENAPVLNTNSTVEYARAGDQTITNKTTDGSHPAYANLVISGSGIKKAAGSTEVSGMTTISSKDATLLVPESTAGGAINTFTANGGLDNGNGAAGNITFENGAVLLQAADASNTNAKINVKRKTNALSRLDYVAWSSPVSGQNLKAFSPNTVSNRFFTYDGDTGSYTTVANPANTVMAPGTGYQIRTPNNFPTYDAANAAGTAKVFEGTFSGTPNNGDITVTAKDESGYILLGNPYPSAMDAQAFYSANQNSMNSAAFYFWNSAAKMDSNNQYTTNSYVTYNATGTVPATAGINGIIGIGQGFLVEKKGTGFTFSNAMRKSAAADMHRRSDVKDRIWLSLKNEQGTESQMLVGYAGGTKAYDAGYDAKMLDSNANLIYSTVNGEKLIIDGRGSFDTADEVPLTVEALKADKYKISLAKKEGVFASQPVFIKNRLTGAVVDISRNAYLFDAAEGTNAGVLSIVYTAKVLGTTEQAAAGVQVYTLQGRLYVRAGDTVTSLKLYDMAGRLITANEPNRSEFNIPVSGEGYAVVALTLKNGTNITKKIKL